MTFLLVVSLPLCSVNRAFWGQLGAASQSWSAALFFLISTPRSNLLSAPIAPASRFNQDPQGDSNPQHLCIHARQGGMEMQLERRLGEKAGCPWGIDYGLITPNQCTQYTSPDFNDIIISQRVSGQPVTLYTLLKPIPNISCKPDKRIRYSKTQILGSEWLLPTYSDCDILFVTLQPRWHCISLFHWRRALGTPNRFKERKSWIKSLSMRGQTLPKPNLPIYHRWRLHHCQNTGTIANIVWYNNIHISEPSSLFHKMHMWYISWTYY
jgi:hypothetical protein